TLQRHETLAAGAATPAFPRWSVGTSRRGRRFDRRLGSAPLPNLPDYQIKEIICENLRNLRIKKIFAPFAVQNPDPPRPCFRAA
ncbi:hypothetical protein, partial [Candidatus Thiosymbion oneisti]|uniref:hypothetical protein n=1 Tax=Candidatus Thiosymbion oneisti TaxID=589554 RepID=UPI001A9C8B3C